MKKQYILGSLLFFSLAANLFQASMVVGKQLTFLDRVHAGSERLNNLPEPQQDEARAIINQYMPELRQHAAVLKQTRQDTFAYITSKDYDRAKAEARFKDVRDQSRDIQQALQSLTLDLADKLTPEQRANVMQLELDPKKVAAP